MSTIFGTRITAIIEGDYLMCLHHAEDGRPVKIIAFHNRPVIALDNRHGQGDSNY